jgi:hypothetical protein
MALTPAARLPLIRCPPNRYYVIIDKRRCDNGGPAVFPRSPICAFIFIS